MHPWLTAREAQTEAVRQLLDEASVQLWAVVGGAAPAGQEATVVARKVPVKPPVHSQAGMAPTPAPVLAAMVRPLAANMQMAP